MRAAHVSLAAASLALAAAFSCSSFSESDSPTDTPDAANEAGGDVNASGTDGPVLHGFSSVSAFTSTTSGSATMTVPRPPHAVTGDQLVLFLFMDTVGEIDVAPFSSVDSVSQCPATGSLAFGYATYVDDGRASYQLNVANVPLGLEAVLVAVGGAGPPDDSRVTDQEPATMGTGQAPGVMVQGAADIVLVGFAGTEAKQGDPPADSGLSLVTELDANGHTMQVYSGRFGPGKTGPFGPFTDAGDCWGTVTVGVPAAQ